MQAPTATLGRLRREARAVSVREIVHGVAGAFARNDLLTYASAISFQVLFALIPFALFVFGVVGGLGLTELYTREIVPRLQDATSSAAFTLIDQTVRQVLADRQLFWITLGAVITVWEMSGASRAIMQVFDRIYGSRRERSFKERYAVSFALATGTGLLIIATVAVWQLGPLLSPVLTIARWPIAIALLSLTVALFVRFAPADRQPLEWVSFGSALVAAAWLGASAGFGFYITAVADYDSIFGALATVIITLTYLYVASVAFLAGAQIDALVRQRLEED